MYARAQQVLPLLHMALESKKKVHEGELDVMNVPFCASQWQQSSCLTYVALGNSSFTKRNNFSSTMPSSYL